MATNTCGPEVVDDARERGGKQKKIEAAGWGLFFVWVGTAFIADVGWAAGFIGVGVIILLGQAARKYFGVKTQMFSILLGSLFILGGAWELFAVQLSLIPVICVVAGVALLVSALSGHVLG